VRADYLTDYHQIRRRLQVTFLALHRDPDAKIARKSVQLIDVFGAPIKAAETGIIVDYLVKITALEPTLVRRKAVERCQ
jgi:hypothetical protein